MHTTRIKIPSIALAVLWVASTVTPVAPQTATHNNYLQMEETSWGLSVSEASLSIATQPVPEVHTVRRPRSEETARVELQVPEALVRGLLMAQRTTGRVELQVPEVLPMLLATEGWEEIL